MSGDYSTFKEKIAKPVSRSFSERKKILQYQYQLKADGRGEMEGRDEGGRDMIRAGQSDGLAMDEDFEEGGQDQKEGEERVADQMDITTLRGGRGSSGRGRGRGRGVGPRKVTAPSISATTATAATAAVKGSECSEASAAASGGSGISRSRFLNAIEVSAEGIAVLRKLHEQVRYATSAVYTPRSQCVHTHTCTLTLCSSLSLSLTHTYAHPGAPFHSQTHQSSSRLRAPHEDSHRCALPLECCAEEDVRRLSTRYAYILTDIYCVLLRTFHLLYICYSDLSYRLTGLPSLLLHSALSFHLSHHLNPNHLITVP